MTFISFLQIVDAPSCNGKKWRIANRPRVASGQLLINVSAFCSGQIFGFVFGKVFNSKPTIHYTIDMSFSNNCSAHLLREIPLNELFAGEWDSKTPKNGDFGPPQAKKYRNFVILFPKKLVF